MAQPIILCVKGSSIAIILSGVSFHPDHPDSDIFKRHNTKNHLKNMTALKLTFSDAFLLLCLFYKEAINYISIIEMCLYT